jgi:hypothetical protein
MRCWGRKHIQFPKRYAFFWESQAIQEVQKLKIPQKANEFVIWLNRIGHNMDWIKILFVGHQFGTLSVKHDHAKSESLHYITCQN